VPKRATGEPGKEKVNFGKGADRKKGVFFKEVVGGLKKKEWGVGIVNIKRGPQDFSKSEGIRAKGVLGVGFIRWYWGVGARTVPKR